MNKKLLIGLFRGFELILLLIAIILPGLIVSKNPLVYQIIAVFLIYGLVVWIRLSNLKKYTLSILDYDEKAYFGGKHIWDFLTALKNIMFTAQSKIKQYEKINQTLQLSIEINHGLIKINDTNQMYDLVLKKAIEAINRAGKGSIMLLNEDNELEFKALFGFDEDFYQLKIPLHEAFLYKLTDGKMDRSVIVPSVVEFNKTYMTPEEFERFYEKFPLDFQTTITAPIRAGNSFLGVINLDSNDFEGFTEEDVSIMDLFASQLEVIIENRNLMMKNQYLSKYDKLTGAINRSYFDEIIKERLVKENPFSFIVIDMNDLKKINDKYGHLKGDQYLKCFSQGVLSSIRVTDVFARIGGDEFVLILNKMDKVSSQKIINRIQEHIKENSIKNELPFPPSFSYGITNYPEEAQSYEGLYIMSDQRMYDMKRKIKGEM